MKKLVKTNVPGFLKDPKSNVIINTDISELNNIRTNRQRYKQEKLLEMMINRHDQEIKELRERIEALECLKLFQV